MSKFVKLLGVLLIVLLVAATGFLFMKVQALESQNESLSTTVTQLKTSSESKLKDMAATLDELKGKMASADPTQHPAAPVDLTSTPPAMNPPSAIQNPVAVLAPGDQHTPPATPAGSAPTTPPTAAPTPAPGR